MSVATDTFLPEGVFRGEDGRFYREVKELVRTPSGLAYRLKRREVALVNPYESDDNEIHKAREAAARKGLDFYDPRVVQGQVIGWLDRGRKRQQEWPENEGNGVIREDLIPVPDDENPDLAAAMPAVIAASTAGQGKTHGK